MIIYRKSYTILRLLSIQESEIMLTAIILNLEEVCHMRIINSFDQLNQETTFYSGTQKCNNLLLPPCQKSWS